MSVRAKFKVTGIGPKEGDGCATVYLSPVISGSEENEKFYRLTPGGQIVLSTVNDSVVQQFAIDGEYYVDFTKAE